MPAIVKAPREHAESEIKARAMREHGAADFTFYENPQVRGLMVKYDPREGPKGAPFMAQAGLKAGAGDWIGYQTIQTSAGPLARFVSIEWKRPGQQPTPAQVAWAEAIRAAGGFAAVVHSAEELQAAMERARKGEDR
jgi:hypothetical protein